MSGDVLDVMYMAAHKLDANASGEELACELYEARVAVCELIEAAEAYSDPNKDVHSGSDWMRLIRAISRCKGAQA